jgi:hypothetical protein
MANITISNLQVAELEYEELSDLEIEAVVGGKVKETLTVHADGSFEYTYEKSLI